jgi:hypothetical protein
LLAPMFHCGVLFLRTSVDGNARCCMWSIGRDLLRGTVTEDVERHSATRAVAFRCAACETECRGGLVQANGCCGADRDESCP